jgi:integrase/recombinase XerD
MADPVSEFLEFLVTESAAAPATIRAYHGDLAQLETYARERRGPNWWQAAGRSTLRGFIDALRRKGLAETTITRKALTIHSFFAFLVSRGLLASSPAEKLLVPPTLASAPNAISPSQAKRLLRPIPPLAPAEQKRNRAMLHLLYATGMKLQELLALNVGDVELEEAEIRVCRSRKRGGRETVHIPKGARAPLNDYVRDARPVIVRDSGQQALFLNVRGERLTRQGFWVAMKAYAKAAGVSADVSVRGLRRGATSQIREGLTRGPAGPA